MKKMIRVLAVAIILALSMITTIFAKEYYEDDTEWTIDVEYEEDLYTGPGIGILDSSWNGSKSNRIYGYGNLNNIEGDEVVSGKAYSSDGPTGYVEYDETNPINHYLIDMGPTSANNITYALHFKDDGGPGMNISSIISGKSQIYNDGGPGFTVTGLVNTQNEYVDKGPIAYDKKVDPRDLIKLLQMKPGDFNFIGGTREDKIKE